MKISTVNVISLDSANMPTSVWAYSDTDEGNQEAETKFREKVQEFNGSNPISDEEMEAALEDGYWLGSMETVFLFHSM